MTVSESPGLLKRFRRTPWKFQQTFQTPLTDLRSFVATIAVAHTPLEAGCVTIDQLVFEPKHLRAMLVNHSIPAQLGSGWSVTAAGRCEVETLLAASLSDWIDFMFVPTPKPFVVFADHDEYTTFYANSKSNLNRITEALSRKGFEKARDYERKF